MCLKGMFIDMPQNQHTHLRLFLIAPVLILLPYNPECSEHWRVPKTLQETWSWFELNFHLFFAHEKTGNCKINHAYEVCSWYVIEDSLLIITPLKVNLLFTNLCWIVLRLGKREIIRSWLKSITKRNGFSSARKR